MHQFSAISLELQQSLQRFMDEHVYPNEAVYAEQLQQADNRFAPLPIMDALKVEARKQKLWNLFVPKEHAEYSSHGGLGFFDYAPLAEIMGRVQWAAEVFNCSAPDTGNMEVLMNFGTDDQKQQWLEPLLDGQIRSSYAMTEPQVASSDASNVELQIIKHADHWQLDGKKWFITGAMNERTRIFIVMGKSDPDNTDRHKQQTQVLVPKDTPGVKVVRALTTLGYDDAPLGHAEVHFDGVKVPLANVLLGERRGFEIAQSRLGPGRMHHCMRLIGAAQRALEISCERVENRSTFGRKLSQHQSVREDISRIFSEIEMARLLLLKTCYNIDEQGVKESIELIAACKTTIPLLVQNILDRCMQMHGAGGLSEDYFLAEAFNYARWCRQADGPDQVHQMALGKRIIQRYASVGS